MRHILLSLFVLTFLSCYEKERNCTDFKTGTFFSKVEIDGKTYTSRFKRDKTLQIETYNNKIDSSSLRWINDCEVVFKTINPKSMIDQKDIHLKILTTTDSSYTYEYAYVGEVQKQRGIAFKVN